MPRALRVHRTTHRYCTIPLLVSVVLASAGTVSAQDTSFAAMQRRGQAAMGVDQYTSSHVFEQLPGGGRIVLRRDVEDSAGVAAIRAHMTDIARRFAAGDFSLPGFVHAEEVPGTRVMAERHDRIIYAADTLPRGGEVRITTTDPEALAAIHAFLAYQLGAHHAAAHDHDAMMHR